MSQWLQSLGLCRRALALTVALPLFGCTGQSLPNSASVSPHPLASVAPPTGGPDLIWLLDGRTPRHYLLFDWSGRRVGAVSVEGQVQPAPDGRQALVYGSTLVDSTGKVLGHLQVGDSDIGDIAWADDSLHLCVIKTPKTASPDAGASSLWLMQPGQAPRRISAIGQPGSDPGITACSITNDRAMIVSDFSTHFPTGNKELLTASVQVIKLSTGAVVYQHDYLATPPVVPPLVMSSADGRYLVETDSFNNSAVIRDITGTTAAVKLRGVMAEGFSGDSTRFVLTDSIKTGTALTVLDRATQKVLWQHVVASNVYLPHRNGAEILFAVEKNGGSNDIYLLPGVGPEMLIAHDAFLVSPCPCLGAGAGA